MFGLSFLFIRRVVVVFSSLHMFMNRQFRLDYELIRIYWFVCRLVGMSFLDGNALYIRNGGGDISKTTVDNNIKHRIVAMEEKAKKLFPVEY